MSLLRRRSLLAAGGAGLALGGLPRIAVAGGQVEEPLADSVRSALRMAVANGAPPRPEFASTDARLTYLRWLTASSDKLARSKADFDTRREFLNTVWYESKRAGLEPNLVLGLIRSRAASRSLRSAASVRAATCRSCRSGAG